MLKVEPCPLRFKSFKFGAHIKDKVPPVKGFKSFLHLLRDFH